MITTHVHTHATVYTCTHTSHLPLNRYNQTGSVHMSSHARLEAMCKCAHMHTITHTPIKHCAYIICKRYTQFKICAMFYTHTHTKLSWMFCVPLLQKEVTTNVLLVPVALLPHSWPVRTEYLAVTDKTQKNCPCSQSLSFLPYLHKSNQNKKTRCFLQATGW